LQQDNQHNNIQHVALVDMSTAVHFFGRDLSKEFWYYNVLSYLTAGKGWEKRSVLVREFSKTTNLSRSQCYRAIDKLEKLQLVKISKDNVIVFGKNKIFKHVGRTRVRLYKKHIKSYKAFMTQILQQAATIVQRRYRWAFANKKYVRNDASTFNRFGIEKLDVTEHVYKTCDIGASLSKISQYVKLSKSTSWNYLHPSLVIKKILLFKCDSKEVNEIFGGNLNEVMKANPCLEYKYRKYKTKNGFNIYFSMYQKAWSIYNIPLDSKRVNKKKKSGCSSLVEEESSTIEVNTKATASLLACPPSVSI